MKTSSVLDSVLEEIKRFAADGMVIISFTDKNYSSIAVNWAKYMHKLNIKNYVIVSLDKTAAITLKKKAINTVMYEVANLIKLADLWKLRMTIIEKLINSDVSVLLSDLDTVWLKNPIPEYIIAKPDYDIIASVAEHKGAFPPEVSELFGFILCMGFIYFQASTASKKFFNRVLNQIDHYKSNDQITVNNLLKDMNPRIEKNDDGSRNIRAKIVNSDDFKLLTLPPEIVWRGEYQGGEYVCQPRLMLRFQKVSSKISYHPSLNSNRLKLRADYHKWVLMRNNLWETNLLFSRIGMSKLVPILTLLNLRLYLIFTLFKCKMINLQNRINGWLK